MLISLKQPSYTVREDLTDGKGFALLICAFLQEQVTQNATVVLQAFTSEDDTATGEVHVLLCFLAALYHALKYIIIFYLTCRKDLGQSVVKILQIKVCYKPSVSKILSAYYINTAT